MKTYTIPLAVVLMSFFSCNKEEKIGPEVTGCYPEYGKLSIKNKVVDAPVVFRMSGGLANGGWLVAENGTSWGVCNLPKEYVLKDSLALSVSGYFVTSDILETINIEFLPFVVTSAKLR